MSLFSSLLVAACERKSILLFDPLAGQLLTARNNAHTDCVNCIRFLDSRMFASCSDDTTVRLWDVRSLKYNVRTLHGHSNWVKNVEYAPSLGLLVTSGFDGSIYTWDINRYAEGVTQFDTVFQMSGLMRTKLTPDCSKLIIATARGFLMVIHNLDLEHLADDFRGFKPNIYRLMHMNGVTTYNRFSHVFTRTRNRLQFLSDFPADDDAEMIASLEVHPQGWCVASRNTSSGEDTEWTCVHDIQDSEDMQDEDVIDPDRCEPSTSTSNSVLPPSGRSLEQSNSKNSHMMTRHRQTDNSSGANTPSVGTDTGSPGQNHCMSRTNYSALSEMGSLTHNLDGHRPGANSHASSTQQPICVRGSRPCLTHYIEEPNVGRGFIKEISFNHDGRLVCSPFGFGVRLLAFSDACDELCDCVPARPVQLYEVTSNISHASVVVTTKFSPTDCLVTGCLSGKVDFHQPIL
ncbi:hypothetical protein NP493_1494g00050 [Ridgeia piscesae]|uniref:Uncharacterized protein n=1 Tax=Ridgeia piscesae TaxID=27915 RepID=A0AAD9NBY6_RIDPI|nr:hypothetical protein NP493_1494g00050 [Ridgeia piscesae]